MIKTLIIELGETNPNIYTHISYLETEKAIKNKIEHIVTPITSFFTTSLLDEYLVIARNNGTKEIISLNYLVNSGEVKISQNAEHMLLSGCLGMVGDDIQMNINKLRKKLNSTYMCNFKIIDREYTFEILYDDKQCMDNERFLDSVFNICEKYLNKEQLSKLAICYDYSSEMIGDDD